MKMEELDLNIEMGAENPVATAFLVAGIASGLSILLGSKVRQENSRKYRYKITPMYIQRNFFKMQLNCIIAVKMVHIMNMIYLLLKKRSGKKYDRTSNRRSYGYGDEQYSGYG